MRQLNIKKSPRNCEYTECYSAEWLRYEARETQKKRAVDKDVNPSPV